MRLPTIRNLDLRSDQAVAAEAAAREARIIRWDWPTPPRSEPTRPHLTLVMGLHSVKAPPDPNLLRIERSIIGYSGMLPVYLPPARREAQ